MHAQQRCRKFVVEFDEYMLGELCICGHIAHSAANHDAAVGFDGGGFDDCVIDRAVAAIAYFLGHFGEMAVEVVAVVGVDSLAQVGHVLVGSAHVVGVSTRHHTVDMVAGGGAGEHVHFEGSTGLVFAEGFLGKLFCYGFGSTGGGESGKADGIAVVDHFGGFGSCEDVECHFEIV